jgi:hypothetical protein
MADRHDRHSRDLVPDLGDAARRPRRLRRQRDVVNAMGATINAEAVALRLICAGGALAYRLDMRLLPDGRRVSVLIDEAIGDELIDRMLERLPAAPLPMPARVRS